MCRPLARSVTDRCHSPNPSGCANSNTPTAWHPPRIAGVIGASAVGSGKRDSFGTLVGLGFSAIPPNARNPTPGRANAKAVQERNSLGFECHNNSQLVKGTALSLGGSLKVPRPFRPGHSLRVPNDKPYSMKGVKRAASSVLASGPYRTPLRRSVCSVPARRTSQIPRQPPRRPKPAP